MILCVCLYFFIFILDLFYLFFNGGGSWWFSYVFNLNIDVLCTFLMCLSNILLFHCVCVFVLYYYFVLLFLILNKLFVVFFKETSGI